MDVVKATERLLKLSVSISIVIFKVYLVRVFRSLDLDLFSSKKDLH